jgi:predicted RNA-binding Zn-ribbon protein involved in translation (DUF1610 family)
VLFCLACDGKCISIKDPKIECDKCDYELSVKDDYFKGGEVMRDYPICKSCGSKMTEYDGCSWYTCPKCGQAIRDNENGSWTWRDEIFGRESKHHNSDFELADFCRGGDLSED